MKSKGTAYILWLFFGLFGIHRFYLGKIVTGVIYMCSFGLFGVGWLYDLFTLGTQVDVCNALQMKQQQTTINISTVNSHDDLAAK